MRGVRTRIAVTFSKVTDLNAVQYILELGNQKNTFTDGAFVGRGFRVFKPRGPNPPPGFAFYKLLFIEWCANQNYLEVTVDGVGPYILS